MNGDSPVDVLKGQVLKYQFPSAFSIGRNVNVSPRFKIHPFVFLLKLLMDDRIQYLKTDEIANIIIVEAENETDTCFEYIVKRLLSYRNYGIETLPADFYERYGFKFYCLAKDINTLNDSRIYIYDKNIDNYFNI